jgi:trehalose synthase
VALVHVSAYYPQQGLADRKLIATHEVQLGAQPLERFLPIVGADVVAGVRDIADKVRARLEGRVIWNINSTATGGGVAEMLRSLIPYVRGVDIDSRWLVIDGTPEFFAITKRLHHALHGSPGDGSDLGGAEKTVYEAVLRANSDEISALVRPRDVVILHDPQTAGLAPRLVKAGAIVIWRCHVGTDTPNEEVEMGWHFLAPYLTHVSATIFSREKYIPKMLDADHSVVIAPSIDPFSAKNQGLEEGAVRAILVHAGLLEGPAGGASPAFDRGDGSPGRVDRGADVIRLGRAPSWDTRLVVQISRWDPLKDPIGVIDGFLQYTRSGKDTETQLVLAGPNVRAIEDDPEAAATLDTVVKHWRALPHEVRSRVELASLPTADLEENAAMVNALQRHATVVVQKSLQEGFGLTVTEAMWKARPVLASAVGGIEDQIVNGEHGLLLKDPTSPKEFASHLSRVLQDDRYAAELGEQARERVMTEYLPIRHLKQYAELLERVDR